MIVNKRCMAAFSRLQPLVALASKSRLFDPSQSLSSELFLLNYQSGKKYPTITAELKFCSLLWCESSSSSLLVAGHENGSISVYELSDSGLTLLHTKQCLSGDVSALDFFPLDNPVLLAGSSAGDIVFGTLPSLDNLHKLEVSLPSGITALACNQMYKKFLAIGTTNGQVVLFDLKKKAQVLRLSNKDFTEVKRISWDALDPTLLRVMTEREFLTVFNLKKDTTLRVGTHQSGILAFCDDILVSSGMISKGDLSTHIPEASDCSISTRDPVMALSRLDGTTEVTAIPLLRQPVSLTSFANFILFCNKNNKIVIYKTTVPKIKQTVELRNEELYSKLIEMVSSNVDKREIADYLFEESADASLTDGRMKVDLKDPITRGLIKGDYSKLRITKKEMKMAHLAAILERNPTLLQDVTDFNEAFAICKIINDYSALKSINNPRILAALLIYCNVTDYSPLCVGKEACSLHGLITGNINEYLNNRIEAKQNYSELMAEIFKALKETMRLADAKGLSGAELASPYIVEYFWSKVARGEYEEVKGMPISDEYVKHYVKERSKPVSDSAHASSSTHTSSLANANSSTRVSDSLASRMSNINVGRSPVGVRSSMPSAPPSGVSSAPRVPAMPHSHAVPGPRVALNGADIDKLHKPLASSTASLPNLPSSPGPRMPTSSSLPSIPKMPASAPIPSAVPRATPRMPGIPSAQHSPKLPSSFAVPSPVSNRPKEPAASFSGLPQPRKIQQPTPTSPAQTVPLSFSPAEVVSRFDAFLADLRERANTKNSLLIRTKKAACLGALHLYEENKSELPANLLIIMDAILKRVAMGGMTLKQDVEMIVKQEPNCVWLRALSDLVRMVY